MNILERIFIFILAPFHTSETLLNWKLLNYKCEPNSPKICGEKAVFLVTSHRVVKTKLFGFIPIQWKKDKTKGTARILFRPTKEVWGVTKDTPYFVAGKKEDPLIHVWTEIDRNFSNFEVEQYYIHTKRLLKDSFAWDLMNEVYKNKHLITYPEKLYIIN
jgi:hypothetical protein